MQTKKKLVSFVNAKREKKWKLKQLVYFWKCDKSLVDSINWWQLIFLLIKNWIAFLSPKKFSLCFKKKRKEMTNAWMQNLNSVQKIFYVRYMWRTKRFKWVVFCSFISILLFPSVDFAFQFWNVVRKTATPIRVFDAQ